MNESKTQTAAEYLMTAESIVVSTGAGMSAESGMETFRDENGLWSKFKPEELATPEAFQRDPLKVWDWYRWRRGELAKIEPHAGHRLLAKWEGLADDLTVVTQNIDGLHRAAGSKNVIELHGRLDTVRCTKCRYTQQGLEDLGADPRCPDCGERLRPGVVWFGEALPFEAIQQAFNKARACNVMVVIGTSGIVQPAASLVETAKSGGAKIIEINPNPTELTYLADVHLLSGCRDALLAIDEMWFRLGM